MTQVMNLLNKATARFCLSVILLLIFVSLPERVNAQKEYTTISKNINPEAQNLYHDLSPQGDSLYLKAESIFYKVTFLNSLDRKVFTFNPPVLESTIPLHDILVGDYTVLVYKKDRIIVFHISRLLEIEKPSQILASKDVAIAQIKIDQPVIPKVKLKEKALDNTDATTQLNTNFDLGIKEIKLAVNDYALNHDKHELYTKIKPYDLTSLDRRNMQSREEYRRNNLRPNGKPYN